MKIIATDNYCRDYISDRLVEGNLPDNADSREQVRRLNALWGASGDWFYKLVADDYNLYDACPG